MKWVRRHPTTAASLGVASLAALGLLTGGIAYEARLRRALNQARSSAGSGARAEAEIRHPLSSGADTLNKMLARLDDPAISQTPRVKELKRGQLEDSLSFYQEVVKGREDEGPAVRLDVAEAYIQAGYNQTQLNRSVEGRDQLTKAIGILERLVNDDPARPEYRFALARACRDLGLPLAQATPRTASVAAFAHAENLLKRSVALFEALVQETPGTRAYRVDLAQAQNSLGIYFDGYSGTVSGNAPTRDLVESRRWFQRAADSYRSLLGPSPSAEDVKVRIQLALNLHNVAVTAMEPEHRAEAPRYYAEGHELLTGVLKVEPNNGEALMSLGITLFSWGASLLDKPATRGEGVSLIFKAIERLKPLVEREPTWTMPRFFLDDCYRTLAEFHDAGGRYNEALKYWELALSLAEGEPKEEFRASQALDLARTGEHRKAWNLVIALEPSLRSLSQHHNYAHRLVAACGSCMAAAEKDASLSGVEQAAACARYGDKGADLARRVLDLAPSADRPTRRKELRETKDMGPLLRRADVQALLVDQPIAPDIRPRAASKPLDSR